MLYSIISDKQTIDELIENFLQKGGKINEYYLKNPKRKPSLVYLDRWYRGKNIKDAISRALSDQS